jgi:hypothetical protein
LRHTVGHLGLLVYPIPEVEARSLLSKGVLG